MVKEPCQHCTKRQVGCHSTCAAYKRFKEEKALEKHEIQKLRTYKASKAAVQFDHCATLLQIHSHKRRDS